MIISALPVFLYKYLNQALAISLFLIIIATTITFVTKDNDGVSFLHQLKLVIKSIIEQKNFKYRRK